jgi:DNA end-binding protein Ku
MPRAVWTGSLTFGLVSIPVSLYPATSPKDVRFHLFDRQGRRVRYRRVSEPAPWEEGDAGTAAPAGPTTESAGGSAETEQRETSPPEAEHRREAPPSDASGPRELGYRDLVRGYEVEPGRFAMLEQDEIERARPERSTMIELEDFVQLEDIDPVYFEKTYYLSPRRDAGKPYALLLRTLERTSRVGIGRFVLRTKPHLVAVRATDGAIALETLYFGDEVRPASDAVPPIDDATTDRELRIAEQLVDMLATSWDPARYADDYREELLRIIAEKAPVETLDAADRAAELAPTSRAEELMEALRRSVEEAKAEKGRGRGNRRAG